MQGLLKNKLDSTLDCHGLHYADINNTPGTMDAFESNVQMIRVRTNHALVMIPDRISVISPFDPGCAKIGAAESGTLRALQDRHHVAHLSNAIALRKANSNSRTCLHPGKVYFGSARTTRRLSPESDCE